MRSVMSSSLGLSASPYPATTTSPSLCSSYYYNSNSNSNSYSYYYLNLNLNLNLNSNKRDGLVVQQQQQSSCCHYNSPPKLGNSFEIVVREARLEDCWQVAETHCSSFFPHYSFPLDLALRVDRLVGLLSNGFSSAGTGNLPNGCRRTCLVAITVASLLQEQDEEDANDFFKGWQDGYVAGILTLDTLADFLPRKGPLRHRRTGIAYVSNVAVRERDRCKGIAKRLVIKAEAQARSWGCRAIALHCDVNNPAATRLYKGQGFKCIKVPERANWPQPKTSPNLQFCFMMKLLTAGTKS